MTPEEQATKVGEHCNHTATWTTACRTCIAAALRTARQEEREECARAMCERCRTTPDLPAFECGEHGEGRHPWWCHDSGVEGWGHYGCSAAAIRARAQESEG